MKKIRILINEYNNTKVLVGSTFLFALFFWLTKLLSFLQHRSSRINSLIHKVVSVLPKFSFVIKNNSGIFQVQAFDDSTTICSDYFENELRGWLNSPTNKDIFVDIGANRGIYTIIAPTLFQYREVHAFEPNLEVVEVLKKNITLNNLTNQVVVHDYALGGKKETANFECDPMHKGGGRISDNGDGEQTTVLVESFDEVMNSLPAWRLSFIKIDTEGFEFKVLYGMDKTLRQMSNNSCIMIESTKPEKVVAVLAKYNFKLTTSKNFDHLFIKNA